MKTDNNRWIFSLIGTLITIIIMVLAYILYLIFSEPSTALAPEIEDYTGISMIDPPLQMPDFELVNQDAEVVNLSNFAGKPVLLTFGFTHCPDVCPITLGEMRAIHGSLGDKADNLQFLFISVDGERDTPQVLNNYLRTLRVDNFLTALTGTEEDVRELGIPYGLEFIYGEIDDFGNYNVEHTAGMFLLNSERQWIRRYAYGIRNQDISADIEQVLAE